MELLIAILIAFGFVNADEGARMEHEEAMKIFTQNNLEERVEEWAKESGTSIWEEESGDFIWEEESGDF